MKATIDTQFAKQAAPLFGGVGRKVARKFAPGQRAHQRHKSGMQLRRVSLTPLDGKCYSASLYVDVRKGKACFGQSATLIERDLKAYPHPFRPIYGITPDQFDLFWGEFRFLPGPICLETEPGYGIRGDVAAIERLIHHKPKDGEVYESSVAADNWFSFLFRSPDHIFTGMVALHLKRTDNATLVSVLADETPAGLIFEECFRAIRVTGLEEEWNPLVEGIPGPADKPAIFLLQGELSNITLACSCVYPDPDAIFRAFAHYGASFITVLDPPPVSAPILASHSQDFPQTSIFTKHCAQECAQPPESQETLLEESEIK